MLSPVLFQIFINDLATDINNESIGVTYDNKSLSLLMYADYAVIIAPTAASLQQRRQRQTQSFN